MQFSILPSIFLAICATQVLAAPGRNSTQNHDDSPSYCLPGCWPESPDICPLVSFDHFTVYRYNLSYCTCTLINFYLLETSAWWKGIITSCFLHKWDFITKIILTFLIVWWAVLLPGLVVGRSMCCAVLVGLSILSLYWGGQLIDFFMMEPKQFAWCIFEYSHNKHHVVTELQDAWKCNCSSLWVLVRIRAIRVKIVRSKGSDISFHISRKLWCPSHRPYYTPYNEVILQEYFLW